jgi:hypothetical protein
LVKGAVIVSKADKPTPHEPWKATKKGEQPNVVALSAAWEVSV